MGHQIFRSMLKLVERLGRERPMAVVFEDWHWADASSADLLEHLLPLALTTPILYVVASRPERQGAWVRFGRSIAADERLAARYRELALAPLPQDDVTQLMHNLLGGGMLPAATRQLLLRRWQAIRSRANRSAQATHAIEGHRERSMTVTGSPRRTVSTPSRRSCPHRPP
jgi:hypothetical protein